VRIWWLPVLGVVWWAGLYAHSLVLTRSLPGLSARRAVSLNLAGSAVANTVPLGGAVSVALTSRMVRSWGFAAVPLGAFLTLSSLWNVLARAVIGALGLAWLLASFPSVGQAATGGWLLLVVAGTLVVLTALTARARTAARTAALVATATRRGAAVLGWQRPDRRWQYALAVLRVRRMVLGLARRSWRALSLGMVAYLLLLALLLDLCLRAVGAPQPWQLVVATVAVERLLTAVPLTPGGAGVAELGITSCLLVGGTPPAVAVAGAVLYRVFTFLLEIPVGYAVTAAWGWRLRRGRPPRPVGTS
jgi:uncharacterized membrane protein YbhN (UPF0104 family)